MSHTLDKTKNNLKYFIKIISMIMEIY